MKLYQIIQRSIVLPLLTVVILPTIQAQEVDSLENSFSISAQIRPRLEIRDGAFRPLSKDEKVAALVSERVRLNFDYSYKDILSIRISPQHVGVWGQTNMVQGADNAGSKFALYETWAKLKLGSNWNMKLGRQVISLDDERFFGELDWAQGGRVHDAISFHFAKQKYELKGFFAFNQNYKSLYGNNLSNPSGNLYSTTDAFPYKWMQTVWAGIPAGKSSKISLLVTNLGLQNVKSATDSVIHNFNSQTYGINYFNNGKKLNGNVSAYFQGGKNLSGVKTQAYMIAAYLGYNIDNQWSIGLGSDFVSGNDLGMAQEKNTAFNPYFHTGHKFYGSMDYYYAGNAHKNVGLSDSYVKLNYKGKQGYNINVAVHQFVTPNKIVNEVEEYAKNLGQEIDFTLSYKLNKFATLSGGYSFYINTPTVNYIKNTFNGKDFQQWAWISLNITPKLFNTKF
ncbi:MAG: alginate export family protein [Chitinophagales bacterium]|nr:alginate export family protein [Chitinophagales bacterium]MCZ2393792.1 alginate export family protein [Chitinophagales bacterium]